MQESELKPCPFCGCEDISLFYYDPYDGYQGDCGVYKVKCNHCGCTLQRKDRADAKSTWNARYSFTDVPAINKIS